MKTRLLAVAVAVLLAGTSASAAADQVGIVKSLEGKVTIVRDGTSLDPVPNQKLYLGDVVQTGGDGKAGLILDDDTVISLGPKSSVAIENFAFNLESKRFSLVARIFRGTVTYLSGRIAKLAPSLVHLMTPHGTVGVRGTHVLIRVD